MKNIHEQIIMGLSRSDAADRLKKIGYNELPSSKKRSIWLIGLEVLKEPMFILLVACGTIYLLLGHIQEALILLGFVFVIMGITLYQERKTERALESLRDLSSPRATVVRDGQRIKISGREVVPGDILLLAEGDRVPADAIVLNALNLTVDESLLTGESVPVSKYQVENSTMVSDAIKPNGENQCYVFSSTLIVQGQGVAQVQRTGMQTEIGKIGKSLQTITEEETLLKKDITRTVKIVTVSSAVICIIVVLVYGITRLDWLHGFLAGLTLAMAMIPEEFPVVLTVFLSLGAWRISHKRVLTRRIPAVEMLGSATVLCVDKTGTLTVNKMKVQKFAVGDTFYDVPKNKYDKLKEPCHNLIEYGILASQTDPFDPMEKAIRELSDIYLADTEHIHPQWEMIQEYPLSKSLLAMSRVWKGSKGDLYFIAAKGAPEAIADLCHFDSRQMDKIKILIETMAQDGLRIIGVAGAQFNPGVLPDGQHDFKFEFKGLIGLTDPIREQVPSALSECYQAGVRTIMITGDYPATAKNIAAQIGLKNQDTVITGAELQTMDSQQLNNKIKNVNIFARVVPEQKLQIINALKSSHEIVAMTGDGVNDAPALKSAHIGIAMGDRGTDVARESADLVLLDDDFMSIVAAIKMGRRIFDNLKKAVSYILAIHVPIAGLSLLPVLFKWPLILYPVHVVFLELIIDPACSLVFEAEKEESNVMNRPPRDLKESLFSRETVFFSLLQGAILLGITASVFIVSRMMGAGEPQTRALAFITLVIGNIGLILSNRSWILTIPQLMKVKNSALVWVVSGALLFLSLVMFVPFLRNLFKFGELHPKNITICIGLAFISIIFFELIKLFRKRKLGTVTYFY